MKHIAHRLKGSSWFILPKGLMSSYWKQIGLTGIGLYAYLSSISDEGYTTGFSPREESRKLGVTARTVRKALRSLLNNNLIKELGTGSGGEYMLRWKPSENILEEGEFDEPVISKLNNGYTNERPIIINNIRTNERCNCSKKHTMHESHQNNLAHELADTLDDQGAFPLYLQFAQSYPEGFLREILDKVLSIPEKKIKRTRGALFTFLVQQGYGKKSTHHHRY